MPWCRPHSTPRSPIFGDNSKPLATTGLLKQVSLKTVAIQDLKPDSRNPRRRTERSHSLIERSLSHYGAARSIVIDEDGAVLAGNGTLEAAAAIGIDQVIVVPSDGNILVAVQRSDFNEVQKREYSISDNRSSDLSEFDAAVLTDLLSDLPDLDITPFFSEDEFKALLEADNIGQDDQEPEPQKPGSMQVKLKFEDETDFNTFLQTLSQLSAALPKLKTTEARLQFILDDFLSGLNSKS